MRIQKPRPPESRPHRFTPAATRRLEEVFVATPTPSREVRVSLAAELQCSERQVQVWLQNKRQRNKRRVMRDATDADDESDCQFDGTFGMGDGPLTCEGVVRPGAVMEIFLEGLAPHRVLWANDDWLQFCGFEASEIVGKTMKVLQGPATERVVVEKLSLAGEGRRSETGTVTNYTKSKTIFRHTVTMEPLVNSSGQLRIFKARSSNVHIVDDPHLAFSGDDGAPVPPASFQFPTSFGTSASAA